ncbi:hypothetical protein BTVI_61719 [Pitangus sulphuratus]|nr:hypothetical protein BTVI_61719 [Pitangus sulphuratus]
MFVCMRKNNREFNPTEAYHHNGGEEKRTVLLPKGTGKQNSSKVLNLRKGTDSKMDLLLDSGSTSGIMYLRRGKKLLGRSKLQPEKGGVRICERNNSADTKVSEGAVGGVAPGARAEISLQPVVRQDVSLLPMEDPTLEQVDVEAVTLGEAHAGAGSWQDLWSHGRTPLEQSVPEGPYHMEGTRTGALHEE